MVFSRHPNARRGFAILLVVVITGISLLVLTGVLNWISTSATISDRNTHYIATSGAAEAAIEKVCAAISRDFQAGGLTRVTANMASYGSLAPNAEEHHDLGNYTFDGGNTPVAVEQISDWQYSDINVRYSGLRGYNASIRVTARASQGLNSGPSRATIQRDLILASIPVVSYFAFYAVDLEICPGSTMTINGLVHGNGTNYFQPHDELNFTTHVTSSRAILNSANPEDPVSRNGHGAVFQGEHDAGVVSLNFPIGTNNSPEMLRQLVEVPPALEPTNSPLGQLRYFNRADLVITVTDTNVVTTSGPADNFAVSVPWSFAQTFISTNNTFFNKRENRQIQATDINIESLRANGPALNSLLGRTARTVYVVDARTQTAWTQAGIRLVNGLRIPTQGLTIATPQPLYVQGDYNIESVYAGTSGASRAGPAALVADAVTILSGAWNDVSSGLSLSSREAANTTVNAAIVTGIVPTGGGYYSGGLENSLRLLEDWSGRTFTFNGSVAVLYYSRFATAPWGASPDIYVAPTRRWSYDQSFRVEAKLPPATPELRVMFRGDWTILSANAAL